jgi:hypothetical protein
MIQCAMAFIASRIMPRTLRSLNPIDITARTPVLHTSRKVKRGIGLRAEPARNLLQCTLNSKTCFGRMGKCPYCSENNARCGDRVESVLMVLCFQLVLSTAFLGMTEAWLRQGED